MFFYQKSLLMKSLKLSPVLGIVTVVACTTALTQPTQAQPVDRNYLCQRFPLNSRCQGYKSLPTQSETNSEQVVKVRLDKDGPNNEWIRVEVNGNTVRLLHTTQVVTGISRAINGIIGAVSPVPIPFDANFYNWRDHQTLQSTFEPDNCPPSAMVVPNSSTLPAKLLVMLNTAMQSTSAPMQTATCAVTGKNQLVLPPGIDLYAGQFTVEYAEREMIRSIKFRLPAKASK